MFGFIYEWTNTVNGKKYIGSHKGTPDDGYIGSGKIFQLAIKKYGMKNFSRTILEVVEREDYQFLLEREKFYLDLVGAYNSSDYYNIAKDVMGGDTKAGWSDERREEYKQQIRNVWANRTDEEKRNILDKSHNKTKAFYQTEDGEVLKQKLRERFELNREKIIQSIKSRDPEDRKRASKLGKERMGEERRKQAARKGVESRNPKTEALAREKAKKTRANWSEEKRKQVFEKSSRGRKGKCTGGANGRAKRIAVGDKEFDTLKDAMLFLGISEGTLNKRLKDENNTEYRYL